jgi:hypothetical protein
MRITRETLIRIASETAQKRALSEPGLVAAYLIGSLRTENPFLGGTTDVDIVFVHSEQPIIRREIIPLTPEFHLDLIHRPRGDYDKPKDLRVHPWLGPELYDPQPLFVTHHFFEYLQAGVRDKFNETDSVVARSSRLAVEARQSWSGLQVSEAPWPELFLEYLHSVSLAANSVALMSGGPLAERRFLLQFPARAEAVEKPELSGLLLDLLGAVDADVEALKACLSAWENDFVDAESRPGVDERIAAPRLAYYKMACESMLASESPQAILWPLLLTWTLSAKALPPNCQGTWESACKGLGLVGPGFDQKMVTLDKFLDVVEEMLEKAAC